MLYTFPQTKRERDKYPLMINLLGKDHMQEPIVRSKSNGLNFFQILYTKSGAGEVTVHGRKSIVSEGQVILIYPREEHAYHAITEEWIVDIVGFSGSCALEMLRTFKMQEPGIYHMQNSKLFTNYILQIDQIREKAAQQGKKDALFVELSKLCYDFLMELSGNLRFINVSIPTTENKAIKEMIAYMEENYMEVISLSTLAEQVNLSRSYISDIFKKEMKMTILQYLNMIRISQARVLLIEHPEMRVKEVGKKCGFENPSYFGEMFKKEVGVTPAEFRLS